MRVGDEILLEPPPGAMWPPRVSNAFLISKPHGMHVDGVSGANTWAIYRALSTGTVGFAEYGVSVYIHQ